jgi:hypothetical protein
MAFNGIQIIAFVMSMQLTRLESSTSYSTIHCLSLSEPLDHNITPHQGTGPDNFFQRSETTQLR